MLPLIYSFFTLTSSVLPGFSIQTRNVINGMNEIHDKLSEIYEWYTDNLKHVGAGPSRPAPTAPPGSCHPSFEAASRLTLEVYVEVPGSAEISLICPKASFHPSWLNARNRGSTSGLFRCHCQAGGGFQQPVSGSLQGDHTAHLQFSRKASRKIFYHHESKR